jgi:hypothetical protein
MEEEANIACGCKKRNLWNYSAKVLRSIIKLEEATAADYGVVVYNIKVVS